MRAWVASHGSCPRLDQPTSSRRPRTFRAACRRCLTAENTFATDADRGSFPRIRFSSPPSAITKTCHSSGACPLLHVTWTCADQSSTPKHHPKSSAKTSPTGTPATSRAPSRRRQGWSLRPRPAESQSRDTRRRVTANAWSLTGYSTPPIMFWRRFLSGTAAAASRASVAIRRAKRGGAGRRLHVPRPLVPSSACRFPFLRLAPCTSAPWPPCPHVPCRPHALMSRCPCAP
jgi:hypothetical protein